MAGSGVRRFGSFELDLEAARLLRSGRTIRIQPQPFRLLCLLTNRPGALVTREEIQAALVRLYRLSGAHAAAAEQYGHYAQAMRELGVEPVPLTEV